MFGRKTLLIVGAGASKELQLPLGTELAQQISRLLYFKFDIGKLVQGDHDFVDGLRRHFKDHNLLNDYLRGARQISDGVRSVGSIDNYIDTHHQDERIAFLGKVSIVYLILKAERNSLLYVDHSRREKPSLDALEKTWLVPFGRYLVRGIDVSQVEAVFSNLTIICFNYDRCIEEFLSLWLQTVYHLEDQISRELVSKIDIIRPYGIVGEYPPKRGGAVEFGKEPLGFDFVEARTNLLTYTEQIEDQDVLTKMQSTVAESETIVFLGFGFHPQNMKLLTPNGSTNAIQVFATAFGESSSNADEIQKQLVELFLNGDRSKTRRSKLRDATKVRNDLKCVQLLEEYSRTIVS